MTMALYQRAINFPSIELSGALADKLYFRLEEMRPFEQPCRLPLPPTVEIIGAYLAGQSAAGTGMMWCSMAQPWYPRLSGSPGAEVYQPFDLLPMTRLVFPHADPRARDMFSDAPILYRRGIDQVLITRELAGSSGQVFPTVIVRGDTSEWPFEDGVAWSMPMDTDTSGTYCIRSAIPPLWFGGATVKVRVKAGPAGCTLSSVGVGKQSGSSPNMVAAPVPLLFGGSASLSLGANAEAWGVASFTTSVGDRLLFDIETAGAYRYKSTIPGGAYPAGYASPPDAPCWYGGTNSSGNATMQGSPTQIFRPYVIDCVKVLA